jgi:hypothetical protein
MNNIESKSQIIELLTEIRPLQGKNIKKSSLNY